MGRACSSAHLTPLRPPRHSLEYNYLNWKAEEAVKDAAGSGVSITFDTFDESGSDFDESGSVNESENESLF